MTTIISDLHITGDPATSEMSSSEIDALCWVIDTADSLIIAGDGWDGWQCDEATMRAWWRGADGKGLLETLLGVAGCGTLGILAGNHDSESYLRATLPEPLRKYLAGTTIQLERGGQLIWVEHWDRGDRWNRGHAAILGRSVTALGAGLERLGWHDVDEAWSKFWGRRWPASVIGRSRDVVEAWAIQRHADLVKAGLCSVLVGGHTHHAGMIAPGVFNCGCWTGGRREWVEITDDGEVKVRTGTPAAVSVDKVAEVIGA